MPYDPKDPPKKLRNLSDKKQRQFVGQQIGCLVIEEQIIGKRGRPIMKFSCRCACGATKIIDGDRLFGSGRTVKSCGCKVNFQPIKNDLANKAFGRWTVVEKASKSNYWKCECSCGIIKDVFRGNLTSGASSSCGCYDREVSSKRMSGSNNPFYNPNLTDSQRMSWKERTKSSKEVKEWRVSIFKKDNYTCINCNNRGGNLNAHHIDGWNWAIDLRFDKSNGATMCVKCHDLFHKKYRSGNNNREQFNEFLRYGHAL
jgi:hypothetical protein